MTVIIEWMRATIPRWGYYIIGPLMVIGLTFGLAALLKRVMPARHAAVAAGAVSFAFLAYGHIYASGRHMGIALAAVSVIVAVAWRLRLDRQGEGRRHRPKPKAG